jgi:hypothetical protein
VYFPGVLEAKGGVCGASVKGMGWYIYVHLNFIIKLGLKDEMGYMGFTGGLVCANELYPKMYIEFLCSVWRGLQLVLDHRY